MALEEECIERMAVLRVMNAAMRAVSVRTKEFRLLRCRMRRLDGGGPAV